MFTFDCKNHWKLPPSTPLLCNFERGIRVDFRLFTREILMKHLNCTTSYVSTVRVALFAALWHLLNFLRWNAKFKSQCSCFISLIHLFIRPFIFRLHFQVDASRIFRPSSSQACTRIRRLSFLRFAWIERLIDNRDSEVFQINSNVLLIIEECVLGIFIGFLWNTDMRGTAKCE